MNHVVITLSDTALLHRNRPEETVPHITAQVTSGKARRAESVAAVPVRHSLFAIVDACPGLCIVASRLCIIASPQSKQQKDSGKPTRARYSPFCVEQSRCERLQRPLLVLAILQSWFHVSAISVIVFFPPILSRAFLLRYRGHALQGTCWSWDLPDTESDAVLLGFHAEN